MLTSTLYDIKTMRRFNTAFKKLSAKDKDRVANVIHRLARGEQLDASYRVHKLNGDLQDCFECHVRGDLVLVYKIDDGALILTCINVGKHSLVFG